MSDQKFEELWGYHRMTVRWVLLIWSALMLLACFLLFVWGVGSWVNNRSSERGLKTSRNQSAQKRYDTQNSFYQLCQKRFKLGIVSERCYQTVFK